MPFAYPTVALKTDILNVVVVVAAAAAAVYPCVVRCCTETGTFVLLRVGSRKPEGLRADRVEISSSAI